MNYDTIKAIAAIFESLPTFETYGYFNESVKSVSVDEDGEIDQIAFEIGQLRKRTARTEDGLRVCWLLDNSLDTIGVFVVPQETPAVVSLRRSLAQDRKSEPVWITQPLD